MLLAQRKTRGPTTHWKNQRCKPAAFALNTSCAGFLKIYCYHLHKNRNRLMFCMLFFRKQSANKKISKPDDYFRVGTWTCCTEGLSLSPFDTSDSLSKQGFGASQYEEVDLLFCLFVSKYLCSCFGALWLRGPGPPCTDSRGWLMAWFHKCVLTI